MNFICFDTEDNSKELGERIKKGEKGVSFFDKKVTQIAAITADGKRYYNKGDVPAFLKWLNQQEERYVYALNIQYDLGNLFSNVLDTLDCTLVGSRMIKAVWGDKIFVDVFNIWFQSVAALGKVFGLQKLETDNMAEDKEYVFRDVEIIQKAMLFVWDFANNLGIEDVPATLGGLGVALWKHWGGTPLHDSLEISRAARFGGRVELFKAQDESGHVAYTDINSLYPACMLLEFPGALEATGSNFKRLGMVTATVRVPECEIAPLPYRDQDGRILFGWGTFSGTWTVAEIINAEKYGTKILKVHESVSTNNGVWPYKTYMERIYQTRLLSKNAAEKELYKRLMNCLYGRTGTSGEIGRTVLLNDRNVDNGIPYGERVLCKYKMPLGEEVNWSHCAYVTSYGRIKLLEHLHAIGADKLIYCDTDSTLFDCPDEKIPFPVGKELGIMKLERRCSGCGEIYGHDSPCENGKPENFWPGLNCYAPKMYNLSGIYKAKGVPKKLQKEFIEQGRAEYDMPYKFREAVSWYDRGNAKRLSVWRTIEKHITSDYDKKIRKENRFFPCEIIDGQ